MARGISISFGGQRVLNSLDLDLSPGEVVLLRGNNGSGKTTLINVLCGNLRPDSGSITYHLDLEKRSEIHQFGIEKKRNLGALKEIFFSLRGIGFTPDRLARLGLGRTWQDVRLFKGLSVVDNVVVASSNQPGERPLLNFVFPRRARRAEKSNQRNAEIQLTHLDLGNRLRAYSKNLSLGQTKRVAIQRALEGGAKVLFLDEPLSGLDANGISKMLDLLRSLAEDRHLALVLVEHVTNIPLILRFATTVWTMDGGGVVRTRVNGGSACTESPVTSFTDYLFGLFDRMERESIDLGRGAHLRLAPGALAEDPLLEVTDLSVSRGSRKVVSDLSFVLRKGDLGIFEAPNGWGKTTVLLALAGILPIKSGEVRLKRNLLGRSSSWRRRRGGLSLLQSTNSGLIRLSVGEACRVSGLVTLPDSIAEWKNRDVGDLSGGQRQLVSFHCACSVAGESVLLLDEPFSALDATGIEETIRLLQDLLRTCAVLIAVPAQPNLTLSSEPSD